MLPRLGVRIEASAGMLLLMAQAWIGYESRATVVSPAFHWRPLLLTTDWLVCTSAVKATRG